MDILRFITAGSVDDGKSTLIGRLLYDTQNIKADTLLATHGGHPELNLAYITDGLRSERDQGITIDISYKYFTTQHRKYIVADAPGHFRYTKNLVTGASNADAVIILIDARNGITEQTKRHAMVCSFLRIKNVVVAINKMDAVGYSKSVANAIEQDFMAMGTKLSLPPVTFIPISALHGDNISRPAKDMPWYQGQTLMQYLESCPAYQPTGSPARLHIQNVFLHKNEIYYTGKLSSGSISVGDSICVYPAAAYATINEILAGNNSLPAASAGQNVTLRITGHSPQRGDLFAPASHPPVCTRSLTVSLCWLNGVNPLLPGNAYLLRLGTAQTLCTIKQINFKTDVHTFEQLPGGSEVSENEFAQVVIETTDAIACDTFDALPATGRGIIIDLQTNNTSGAFTVV